MNTKNINLAQERSKRDGAQQKQNKMAFPKVMQRYALIVVLNLVIIFVMVFFISPFSKIDTVSVIGNEAVYDQEVINESHIHKGDSLIQTYRNLDRIEKELIKELPQVEKANAEITDINNVQIDINEFKTVAYIAQDGSYLRVLEDGSVLEDTYNVSIGNQPVLSKFEEGETLDSMIEELSQLDSSILALISEIELVEERENPLFIRVYMNNGNRVLSSIPEFSEKIPYYPQMVKAVDGEKGVFDMEAGVYFIPFTDEDDEDSELDEEAGQALEEFDEE